MESMMRNRSNVAELLFATLLTVLMFGCGSATTPPESRKGQTTAAPVGAKSGAVEACSLLAQKEIADLVGNPVMQGQPFAGPEVCKWDTENPDHVSVLLTVRPKASVRETTLCAALRKGGEGGVRVQGLGDVAMWKFSSTAGLFNSGDLDACGEKGYVSVSLNGKRDEAALQQAGTAIVQKVFQRP